LDDSDFPGRIVLDASALLTDAHGRTWWATRSYQSGVEQLILLRFTPAGALDTAFGAGGIAVAGPSCSSDARIAHMDLALLPGDAAVILFRYGTGLDPFADSAGMRVVRESTPAAMLRCDLAGTPVASTLAIAARDAASFFGVGVNCNQSLGCGPSLRRFTAGHDGRVLEDPSWDVEAATVYLPAGLTPPHDGLGLGVAVIGSAAMFVGLVQDEAGDADAQITRLGVLTSVFRSSFE
jgi:hypothetical protein